MGLGCISHVQPQGLEISLDPHSQRCLFFWGSEIRAGDRWRMYGSSGNQGADSAASHEKKTTSPVTQDPSAASIPRQCPSYPVSLCQSQKGTSSGKAPQPCFRPGSRAARRVGVGQPRDSTFSQRRPPHPRSLLLDSRSLGSGACAALWCMVPTYPSPMASGSKAARDRWEFRGDFMILVFLRGCQFSPALPSFLPDCQLC